jgi:hypothetical protein
MRQLKIKKSRRHNNKLVNVLTRKNGQLEVVTGLMKGYLGGDILVDTGNGLYDHVVMGSASGASLVLPACVPIRISKAAEQKIVKKSHAPVYNDGMLTTRWEDDLPPAYQSSRYGPDPADFSVSESYWQ